MPPSYGIRGIGQFDAYYKRLSATDYWNFALHDSIDYSIKESIECPRRIKFLWLFNLGYSIGELWEYIKEPDDHRVH